jgi:hypothetical protein
MVRPSFGHDAFLSAARDLAAQNGPAALTATSVTERRHRGYFMRAAMTIGVSAADSTNLSNWYLAPKNESARRLSRGSGRCLRGRNHLPSRDGPPRGFRLQIVDRAIMEIEVGFQLRHGEMLPFVSLPQERTALEGTEGGGSPVQRSDCAVSAHVFHDNFPIRRHELCSPFSPAVPAKVRHNDFLFG